MFQSAFRSIRVRRWSQSVRLATLLSLCGSLLLAAVLPVLSVRAQDVAYKFDFAPTGAPAVTGYTADTGDAFGPKTSGLVYGWVQQGTATPYDMTTETARRSGTYDELIRSLIQMQRTKGTGTPRAAGAWQIQIPNGTYVVTVTVGDNGFTDSTHRINIEGVNAIDNFVPTVEQKFAAASLRVAVSDNVLTIDAVGGTNTKITHVTITTAGSRPYVTSTNPQVGQAEVLRNAFVSAEVKLPNANGGIDAKTLSSSTVKLTRASTGALIPANVNTSGGGDVIVLQPTVTLESGSDYTFEITDGVKDLTGQSFIGYRMTFKTGSGGAPSNSPVKFTNVGLTNTFRDPKVGYTSVTVGPDNKVYAGTLTGEIVRFPINPDGTLGAAQSIPAFSNRVIIGLTFDPGASASNLVLWTTNNDPYGFNANDFSGRITRVVLDPASATPREVKDYVVGLPRSKRDHLTNSIAFQPGSANVMFVPQGTNSAMGYPDNAWGLRAEQLLSGTILRIDLGKITAPPLNVQTAEGGNYNPFGANAPVTIYATGVRNAYDLLWHSNGSLYAPANGSAAGGNTPGVEDLPADCTGRRADKRSPYPGPNVGRLTNVRDAAHDFLFRILENKYYGAPNPLRCELVLNGGNPTSGGGNDGPTEARDYPAGTPADPNYAASAIYDLGLHYSPNGVIEYKNNAFGTLLQKKMLVARWSGGDDIVVLTVGANGDLTGSEADITGLNGFNNPLDLIEDPTTGNVYVTELPDPDSPGTGQAKITLLQPQRLSNPPTDPTLTRRVWMPLIAR